MYYKISVLTCNKDRWVIICFTRKQVNREIVYLRTNYPIRQIKVRSE